MRRILITGGSSGIGLETARRLAADGDTVVLVARGPAALDDATAALPGAVTAIAADVRDAEAIRNAIDSAAETLGGLDAVIANAGSGVYGPFRDMGPDDYVPVVETTLMGAIHTARAALPHLERSGGTLVFVGSIAGRIPTPWLSAYTAAKHGVRGFARSLRAELRALGSPVSVAVVAPGPVDTPFWVRARTTDRRLPPRIVGAYRPGDVAAEVIRALHDPRAERTVGGLMAAWALFDAMLPNVALRATGAVARLGWRKREAHSPSPKDGVASPDDQHESGGGLASRPSLVGAMRDRIGR